MCEEKQASADVQETALAELDKNILLILLKDRSTGKNILWATDDYKDLGIGFAADDEITLPAITGAHGNLIKPRALKSKEEQGARTRNMAEVFTPLWICNKQNNLADNAWFGRENAFNTENGTDWQATEGKIAFPGEDGADGWRAYIASKRLEITCGEAPYLASRYDTMTGEIVPLAKRIGLLDRKLRVINERTRNFKDKARAKKRWLELATLAVRSIYGFEWAGDNILLARENLLFTVADYYAAKFGDALDMEMLEHFAETISWNIWQMDGLKAVVPNSCHDYKKEHQPGLPNLFSTKDFSARTLKRSVSPCDVDENERQMCQACLKDTIEGHNGVYCQIRNWSTGKILVFKDMLDGEGSEGVMSKDFKFDVVIGNPPYQTETAEVVSTSNNQKPVRNIFQFLQESSDEVAGEYVCLIYPAGRWIHRFGKGLQEFGLKQINDPRLKKIVFYPITTDIFPGIQIADGISIVLKDVKKRENGFVYDYVTNELQKTVSIDRPGEQLMPLNPFDIEVCKKIDNFVQKNKIGYLHEAILPRSLFKIESDFVEKNPDKVQQYIGQNYDSKKTIKLFTNDKAGKMGRAKWFLADREVVSNNQEYIDEWQVVVSSANAGGQKRDNQIEIIDNNSAFGRSRVALRSFKTEKEAKNFYDYACSYLIKYAFLMTDESLTSLGKRVPDLINYADDNGIIDFSSDINQQFYDLLNLSTENIAYIENKVKNIRKG